MKSNPTKKSSPLEIIEELNERGLSNNFKFKAGKLICIESQQAYDAADLTLEASYRFEGQSDPDDSSVLYVIKAHDGTGGTIMDAFGVGASPGLAEFCRDVEDLRKESEIMANVPAAKTIVIKSEAEQK